MFVFGIDFQINTPLGLPDRHRHISSRWPHIGLVYLCNMSVCIYNLAKIKSACGVDRIGQFTEKLADAGKEAERLTLSKPFRFYISAA